MPGKAAKRVGSVRMHLFLWTTLIQVATVSTALAQAPGTFSPTGNMTTARARHTATLLPDGRVLIAGGSNSNVGAFNSSTELYDPSTNIFSPTGNMIKTRVRHTATLLPNGKVLIAGGSEGSPLNSSPLNSAELFDPSTGTFVATGNMTTSRTAHTATQLLNGKVLIAGGQSSSGLLNTAEIYDPATGAFTPTGIMGRQRFVHTATLLPGGKVLLSGGVVGTVAPDNSEFYDPDTGTFSLLNEYQTTRLSHTSTALLNGNVLITGGQNFGFPTILQSAELYNVIVGGGGFFSDTNPLGSGRASHTATLLPSSEVLVAGGSGQVSFANVVWDSNELFNPVSRSFRPAGNMSRGREGHTATLLANGKVLIAGGFGIFPAGHFDSAELYNSVINQSPVANAGPDQTRIVIVPMTLDGSASSDHDGSIVSYAWDFGDGSLTANGVVVNRTYSNPGSYTVTLTVIDDGGASASDTAQVTIQTPIQATQALISTIEGSGLPQGAQRSLIAKLRAALSAINRSDRLARLAGVNQLQAFVFEVAALQGVRLTPEQAASLATAAQQIILSLTVALTNLHQGFVTTHGESGVSLLTPECQ